MQLRTRQRGPDAAAAPPSAALGPAALLLAGLLFAAWVACFALVSDDVARGTAVPPLRVAPAAPGAYPAVAARVPGGDASPLAAGDRLLAVGGRDLAGAGPLAVQVAFARFTGGAAVPVRYARGARVASATVVPGSFTRYWPRLPASLAFAVCALFLLWRARPSPVVRALVFTNLWAALFFACTFAGGPLETRASALVHVASLGCAAPLGLRVVQLFPHARAPTGAARLLPWPFAALALFDASRFYAFPFSHEVGVLGSTVLGLAYVAAAFAVVRRSWRCADPVERRQLKWMLLGGYLAVLPFCVLLVLAAFDSRFAPLLAVAIASLAVFPVLWIVAIVRFNWFDIDRLLGSAASYTILLVGGLGLAMGATPMLAQSLSARTGLDGGLARFALSLGVAALIVPAHRRLRPEIDRIFFAERFALARGIDALLARVGTGATPEALLRAVGEELDRLLRPRRCLAYVRSEGAFVPAFARGPGGPAALSAQGAWATALEARAEPLAGEAPEARGDPSLGDSERALLEALDVSVVVPVRGAGHLAAFLCLGEKRSGDVYTATDRALLSLVADRTASQIQLLEQARALEQDRAARARLRRYVVGSLADQLDRGEEIDLGEVEVSVLFVDVRGYSRYAEPLAPREIFAAISRFAEVASAVLREHGGTVVEFAGDGMMALFGAPRPRADREAAAVAAARALPEAMAALARAGGPSLTVGVGVATGPAFVGSVRVADRAIWTALGNTTNLASRLQSLTRELDAAVILDAATHARAGAAGADFVRVEGVRIRGREAPETIFELAKSAG